MSDIESLNTPLLRPAGTVPVWKVLILAAFVMSVVSLVMVIHQANLSAPVSPSAFSGDKVIYTPRVTSTGSFCWAYCPVGTVIIGGECTAGGYRSIVSGFMPAYNYAEKKYTNMCDFGQNAPAGTTNFCNAICIPM